jgi:hypothetical protein
MIKKISQTLILGEYHQMGPFKQVWKDETTPIKPKSKK